MYWINLYKDIRIWMKFAKVAKESEDFLAQHHLRVDRLGRIYTVVNLPEEVQEGNDYMHEAWVLQHLKPYTEVLLKIGLADYSYPEISRIEQPNVAAYLVVMYPEAETIGFWPIIKNIMLYAGGFLLLKLLFNIFIQYDGMGYLTKLINFIF